MPAGMDSGAPDPYPFAPTVDIDLDALCANFRTIKAAAPRAEAAAVVKCDAYGLGAEAVARALVAREGCHSFFVAYAHEGAHLRAALADSAPGAVIYVFNGPDAASIGAFADCRLTPVLNTAEQARLWVGARPSAPAALHIDTGMNRLGAPMDSVENLAAMRGLKITLIMSHLACASDPGHAMNDRQRAAFENAARYFPQARKSLSASGGALMGPAFHYDLVRPGVALYGVSPFDRPDPRLKPVARLTAPILQLRDVSAGDSAGYGATSVFKKAARLATVALGYGDGFPRAAGNRSAAFAGGALCPVVGRVSMDLIILDVTNAPQPVEIGDRAEFFGPHLPIENAAASAGTIGYELLTGLGARAARRYLSEGRAADASGLAEAGINQ